MANDECGRHADVDLLAVELLLHDLFGLLRDRHEAVDEELGDARDEFHHSAHDDAQREDGLGGVAIPFLHAQRADERSDDDTQNERFAQHAELLFQPLGVDVELGETGNLVQEPVDADGKGNEALAEGLWDADAVEVIVLLEAFGCEVGHDEREHIAHDGSEVAPTETLALHEIDHGADEGEMPVVPQVDVHRARSLGEHHEGIDT